MSRAALGGRVTAYVNAGGSVGSVVKSLILGTPTPREARARNTAPTATASAPPRPRPRPRAAWTTLATPATSPTIPPSAKSPKPAIPGTIRSHASAGPITKSAPAITPKALRRPARDVPSSMAPPPGRRPPLPPLTCPPTGPPPRATAYSVPPAGGGASLSPFPSPLIITPGFPYSPALLTLLPPILFRATCYYYRKAYYRSYFLDPPACAVGEPRGHGYRGETAFPFILQNLHRYAFYITFVYLFFLWRDVFEGARFGSGIGIGVGTLVLLINTAALTLYSFSCHSARHLVGGTLDCFSCSAATRARHSVWRRARALHQHHMSVAC